MDRKDESAPGRILTAAFHVFSKHTLAETSMAKIAGEAGMSRPALYQYFDDKSDIYRSMLEQLLDRSSERAMAALADGDSMSAALDGFLQQSWGDKNLWQLSRHQGPDLVAAKAGFARPVVEAHHRRLRQALRRRLASHASSKAELEGWVDIVRFAPIGFTYDQPTLSAYRRRLSALAAALAAAAQPEAADQSWAYQS